jgi:hypothetical protein
MPLDKEEFLWRMVNEHMTQARHQETLRSSMTTLLVTLSGAIVAFVTFDKGLTSVDLPPSVLLLFLGVFGVFFSAKHYERFNFHIARVRAYRRALEECLPNIAGKELRENADKYHEERFPTIVKLRQHWLWLVLHSVNALIGVILVGTIVVGLPSSKSRGCELPGDGKPATESCRCGVAPTAQQIPRNRP